MIVYTLFIGQMITIIWPRKWLSDSTDQSISIMGLSLVQTCSTCLENLRSPSHMMGTWCTSPTLSVMWLTISRNVFGFTVTAHNNRNKTQGKNCSLKLAIKLAIKHSAKWDAILHIHWVAKCCSIEPRLCAFSDDIHIWYRVWLFEPNQHSERRNTCNATTWDAAQ